MGYLESSVVVYLRVIMYPAGFAFPLVPIEEHLAITEIYRETATLIMLLGAGIIAGKSFTERFAWFIYCFAVWDIFYYVFLKILLNWPESLMTWDILFLIPITWVGPVVAPVLVSITMILLALVIVCFNSRKAFTINWRNWCFFITGSLVVILSFVWDYSKFILNHYSFSQIWSMPDNKYLYNLSMKYIPHSFNWFLFIAGELTIITGIMFLWLRVKKTS